MNAVIYARYSYSGQRDVSIEDQVREIEYYAKLHEINILHVYADRAKTGKNDRRPEFQQMIRDASKKLFSCVLVYKYDRYARNQYDAIIYKHKLAEHGVKLIAVMEPIPDGHGAKILESIYLAMAEEYSENLAQNVRRGMEGNALKAMANCRPPYGYRINKDTRKYEVDPVNAPVVKKLFSMAIQGYMQKDMLDYMKSIGKPKSFNWLYILLRNERYTGVYIYDNIRVEGGMPELVSKADFEKVRAIMLHRQHSPQANPAKFPLSGKVWCGKCGSLVVGESARNRFGSEYRYYVCGKQKKRAGGCNLRRRRADFLEHVVAQGLRDILFRPEVVDRLVEDVYRCMTESRGVRLESLNNERKEIESKIGNISRNIERVDNVPVTLLARLSELEKEKAQVDKAIAEEELRIRLPKEGIKEFILNFNTEMDEPILRTFVTRVTLYDDRVEIEYDASGDNKFDVKLPDSHTETSSPTNFDMTRTFFVQFGTLLIIVVL